MIREVSNHVSLYTCSSSSAVTMKRIMSYVAAHYLAARRLSINKPPIANSASEFGSGTEDSVNVKSNYHYGHGAQSDNLKRMN